VVYSRAGRDYDEELLAPVCSGATRSPGNSEAGSKRPENVAGRYLLQLIMTCIHAVGAAAGHRARRQVPTLTFPVYILRLGNTQKIVFPEHREDIGHSEFWGRTVSHIVARHFGIPQSKLANLPYCQGRARVVGNRVYYGGKPDSTLLPLIRQALGNDELVFVYDHHEKRLREDVREFRRLVKQAGRSA
jgi:hypothetical protein